MTNAIRSIISTLRSRRRARLTFADFNQFSDRALADIGLERYQIDNLARAAGRFPASD